MTTLIKLMDKAREVYSSLPADAAIEDTQYFKQKGDMIYLIGSPGTDVVDLDASFRTQKAANALQRKEWFQSCSPMDRYGLMALLLQSAIPAGLGFDITSDAEMELHDFLFKDLGTCYLVTVSEVHDTELIDYLYDNEVEVMTLGHVTKGQFRIDDESFGYAADYRE